MLRDVRQRHAVGRLVEARHQIEARRRNVEAFAHPAAHFPIDQGCAGQEPGPQPQVADYPHPGYKAKTFLLQFFYACDDWGKLPSDTVY